MNWTQKQIVVGPYERGFHLITDKLVASVPELRASLLRLGSHIYSAHVGFANHKRERRS